MKGRSFLLSAAASALARGLACGEGEWGQPELRDSR